MELKNYEKEDNRKNIFILTSNKDKFEEFKFVCDKFFESLESSCNANYEFKMFDKESFEKLELFEIQSDNSEEIVKAKCRNAISEISSKLLSNNSNPYTIVMEDTSFSIDGMNGLPGPYIRDFFLKLGNKKFYQMAKQFEIQNVEGNYTIKAKEESYIAIAISPGEKIYVFKGEVKGTIVEPDNLEEDEYNWNFFFIPENSDKTYGRMSNEEKCILSARGEALRKVCEFLLINKDQ